MSATETLVSARLRNVALLGLAAFYLYVYNFGFPLLLARELDAAAVERLASTGRYVTLEGSYGATALVFTLTDAFTRSVYLLATAVPFVWLSMKEQYSLWRVATMSLLLVAPIVFFLTQFNKDALLVPFVLAAAAVLGGKSRVVVKVALVSAIYVAYAYLFRTYYFLIIALFGFGYVLRIVLPRRSLTLMVIALPLVFALGLLIPGEIYDTLVGSRDAVNSARNADVGSRTAFYNLVAQDGYLTFIVNYAYALLRLNVPLLFAMSPLDIFAMFYTTTVWIAILWGRRSGDPSLYLAATLILSHMLVLTCFEPDLGTYLRHVATTVPYVALIVARRRGHVEKYEPALDSSAALALSRG